MKNDANGRNVFEIMPCDTCIETGVYKKFAEVLTVVDGEIHKEQGEA